MKPVFYVLAFVFSVFYLLAGAQVSPVMGAHRAEKSSFYTKKSRDTSGQRDHNTPVDNALPPETENENSDEKEENSSTEKQDEGKSKRKKCQLSDSVIVFGRCNRVTIYAQHSPRPTCSGLRMASKPCFGTQNCGSGYLLFRNIRC
ncbi:MAG: hypothetical protein EAZ57_11140 [Cytophagales bacterium]|nr:MAG: hypothetical protein EAZ67_11800 [Cytophagales bacterium]TAF59430.1 MAG: hypothetical protein EAZ57_11140 [Cytophagales bacterium]